MTMKMKGRLMFAERPKRDVGSGGSPPRRSWQVQGARRLRHSRSMSWALSTSGLAGVADPSMDGDEPVVVMPAAH